MTWRERAQRVVAAVLADLPPDATEDTARRELRLAYPFGPREHFPYTVWCEEVRHALNRRYRGIEPEGRRRRLKPAAVDSDTLGFDF